MRILAITFALSLIGCVDDNTIEESQENTADDVDPTVDQTGDLPNDNKCGDPSPRTLGDGNVTRRDSGSVTDSFSRKKADSECF